MESKLWKVKTGRGKYSVNHKNYNFLDCEENANLIRDTLS